MKIVDSMTVIETATQAIDSATSLEQLSGNTIYHELGETHLRVVHPLEQLENNLEMLSQLRSRLQFMLREVRYILKVE